MFAIKMKPADNSIVRFKGPLASDADILFAAAFGDTGVMQHLQWDTHKGPDETRVLIEEMIGLHQRGDKYFWMAHCKSDDRIVGLGSIKPDSDTAWIGFLVLAGEQRKGFGAAIISALEDVVLGRFESVSAAVDVRNRSSVNLLRKAGWSEWANADVSPLLAYRKQKANKTDAGNGSEAICRVSNVLRSPSPDPRRWAKFNMKPLIAIILSAIFLFNAGCNAEPKGMKRKIDGSSDAAAKQSVEKLTTELSPDELKKFTNAYGQLALRWAFSNAFSGKEKQDSSEFLKIINGKTPQEVIDLAAAHAADQSNKVAGKEPEKAKEKESKLAHVNLPFNIDGIEILISDLRFGELEKIVKQYSFGSVPKGEFLLATVALKNTTEGKIIQIQDVWGDTTVTDNFDNIYNKPGSLTYSSGDVKGAISSQALKPGETASDLIIIDKPLDNAQEFTLRCDPNFFRSAGNNMLHQLSSDSFHLKFKRADIKQSPTRR